MSVANNLTGKTLSNRYEILRPLGEGGMGKVYLAKDKRFGKQVVVKVPTMEAGDKDFKDRFMREIASLATLEHLHIVTTVDWGEIEGIPFLVLRYLSGGSLRDRITDAQGYYKPMPLEGLNQWLPQIASALDFIHTKNWVHRDLKPDNILFDEAGNSYLADFGIAKALEGAPMGVKTTMGAFIGTPQYMAPEMHLGKGIGPRADQFGLAVLVYEALAGKIPFAGTTPTAIFVEVMQGKARPIHELVPGIPLEKSNALMKGITKEPRDRYGSCVEFANAVTGSMLARGSSSAGNETPSRVVIPGTKMETPKKADIPGTRMETPSKPEILGIKNETPTKPVIAGTRLETHSQPEITGTNLETPSNRGSNPEVRLLGEDYLTKEGQLLAQVCRDLVEAGKVTKELFLEARKFCKSNDVTGMLGGVLLAEKIESIVKAGHVSKEISQEIVSLARDTLGLGKPVIAGTRTERNGVKLPANITEESFEEPKFSSIRFNSSNAKGSTKELFIESELYKFLKGGGAVVLLLGVLVFLFIIGALIYAGITSSWSKPSIINLADGIVSIEKDMVMVPAGRFIMGSPESEKGRYIDETQHEVTITNHFYMGKYEITQEQWETVMGNNPSSRDKGAKLPVTDVSWEDCQEFIKKLNAKTNGGYRLPTEAEWEYACRAETTTAYSFGEDITPKDANYDESKIDKPVAVGSYKPNAFGLYDMHGNVWEWCNDWYGSLQNVEVRDSKGPATGERRVLRGGSFYIDGSKARSSGRFFYTPTYRVRSNGFRLAKTINPSDLLKPNIKAFLLKLKQEEEAKAKQTELVKLKQEEESKAKQTELVKLKQKEEAKFAAIEKEMVLVPAGKFMMGSPASEKGRFHEETHHEVTLTKPFYMGKYEVTQEQYEAVMGKNPGDTKGAKLPVTDVSWYDCQEFIKKLNANTKGGYRLPTDAEWEYACRAGTSTAYSYGDSLTKSDANIDGVSPKTVGNYKPNEFGLYDLHGNVWEWCEDWKADYPAGAVTDPKGPGTGTYRVLRGGSFINLDSAARSSVRRYLEPSDRDLYYGFRLARNP